MIKVAITGNIAAGKSTVEKFLTKNGYKTIDTDEICHDLMCEQNILEEIIKEFGNEILLKDKICRKKLGEIVFKNANNKKKLEQILHPKVGAKLEDFFAQNKSEKITFTSIPLLYEAGFERLFDKVILIYADDEIRLNRTVIRDNLTKKEALKRMQSQISQEDKLTLADYIFYNNEKFDELAMLKIIQKCSAS